MAHIFNLSILAPHKKEHNAALNKATLCLKLAVQKTIVKPELNCLRCLKLETVKIEFPRLPKK
jgi:hypothetical protein